jgi:hypothetical protein
MLAVSYSKKFNFKQLTTRNIVKRSQMKILIIIQKIQICLYKLFMLVIFTVLPCILMLSYLLLVQLMHN